MKGYVLFFIFVLCSFALADDGVVGYVKIKGANSPRYTSFHEVIPDSMNNTLSIKSVYLDKINNFVVLIPTNGSVYDAIVFSLNGYKNKKIIATKLTNSLRRGFLMEISANDLVFDSRKYLSTLMAHASDIETLSVPERAMAIKTCKKNLIPAVMWLSRGYPDCF